MVKCNVIFTKHIFIVLIIIVSFLSYMYTYNANWNVLYKQGPLKPLKQNIKYQYVWSSIIA